MPILIKRYANRKLYDTRASRYITLKGIAELLDQGEDVQVIDNESGEDITNVALSQILVDSERSNSGVPGGLLSQILGKGGDALYGALKRGVDDASDNFEEIQERLRRIVTAGNQDGAHDDESRSDGEERSRRGAKGPFGNWIAYTSPDVDHIVQDAIERVFKLLDLPRRSDVDALNRNLERVADAVETLERSYAGHETDDAVED